MTSEFTPEIVKDNEQSVAKALQDRNYIQAFLLVHILIESLLRVFLNKTDERISFRELITAYEKYLKEAGQAELTFVDDLIGFNHRRNKIVHELWIDGFSKANLETKPDAIKAILIYGLFIEWIETFDPEISESGFTYDK